MHTDSSRSATTDRARRTAELIALCRSTSARGSEAVLALTEARARLSEATRAHAAYVRAHGVAPAEAIAELRAALAAVDSHEPAEFGLVCEEVLARFTEALAGR